MSRKDAKRVKKFLEQLPLEEEEAKNYNTITSNVRGHLGSRESKLKLTPVSKVELTRVKGKAKKQFIVPDASDTPVESKTTKNKKNKKKVDFFSLDERQQSVILESRRDPELKKVHDFERKAYSKLDEEDLARLEKSEILGIQRARDRHRIEKRFQNKLKKKAIVADKADRIADRIKEISDRNLLHDLGRIEDNSLPDDISSLPVKNLRKSNFRSVEDDRKSYSKEERLAFRTMNDKAKAKKKAEKKKRQATRKLEGSVGPIVTESSESTNRFGIPSEIWNLAAVLLPGLQNKDNTHPISHETHNMLQIILYIVSMAESRSSEMDLMLTLQMSMITARAKGETGLNKEFEPLSILLNTINVFRRRRQSKTLSTTGKPIDTESLTTIGSYAKMFLSSTVYTALRDIVLLCIAGRMVGPSIAGKLIKWFGKPLGKVSIPDAIIGVLESVSGLSLMLCAVSDGAPLSTIFTTKNPLETSISKAELLIRKSTNLYYGLPVEDQMCAKQFMRDSGEVLETMAYFLKKLSPIDVLHKQTMKTQEDLRKCRNGVKKRMDGQVRSTPFVIVIHGEPGTGKSSIVNYSASLFSHIKGREHDQSLIYPRNITSQYWDGYDQYSTPYGHYSELGNLAKAIAKAKGDDLIKEFCSVADSLPFGCDMSKTDDKGTVYCLMELILVDTNNPDLNLNETVNNPAAFRRRLVYVEVTVKPEFKKADSDMLDGNIESDDFYDKWLFNIYLQDAVDSKTSRRVDKLTQGDIHQYTSVMNDLMRGHIDCEERIRKKKIEPINHLSYLPAPFQAMNDDTTTQTYSECTECVEETFSWIKEKRLSNQHVRRDDLMECISLVNLTMHTDLQNNNEDCSLVDLELLLRSLIDEICAYYHKKIGGVLNRHLLIPQVMDYIHNCLNYELDDNSFLGEIEEDKSPSISAFGISTTIKKAFSNFKKFAKFSKEPDHVEKVDETYDWDEDSHPLNTEARFDSIVTDHLNSFRMMKMAKATRPGRIILTESNEAIKSWVWSLLMIYVQGCVGYAVDCGISIFVFLLSLVYFVMGSIPHLGSSFTVVVTVIGLVSSYYFNWMWWIFTIFGFLWINLEYIKTMDGVDISSIEQRKISMCIARDTTRMKAGRAYDYVRGKLIFENVINFKTLAVVSICSAVIAKIYLYKKNVSKIFTEASVFRATGKEVEEILKCEVDLKCGKSYERIPVKNTKIYNSRVVSQSVHTGNISSLHAHVMRNKRFCTVNTEKGARETFLFGLCSKWALIHKHAFMGCDTGIIRSAVSSNENFIRNYIETVVQVSKCVVITNDLILIGLERTSFVDITDHFPIEDVPFDNGRGMMDSESVIAHKFSTPISVNDTHLGIIDYGSVIMYKCSHASGQCGLPVVVQRFKNVCIAGIHSAGERDGELGFGIVLTKKMVLDAVRDAEIGNSFHLYSSVIDFTGDKITESSLILTSQPHFKSFVNYEDIGCATYLGFVQQPNMNQKSKLEKSIVYDDISTVMFDTLGFIKQDVYVRPMMKPTGTGDKFISPYNNVIRKMCAVKKCVSPQLIVMSVRALISHLSAEFRRCNVPKLQPLDIQTAVNGVSHDTFIRRMDVNKAAGFGKRGKKSKYMTRYNENNIIEDEPIIPVLSEIKAMIDCYLTGTRCQPVFDTHLKDEARLLKKALEGNTRAFYGSPLTYLIVHRMFLGPFYSLMIELGDSFCTSIGIDMHREAHTIYEKLGVFPDHIMEGDYGGYDVRMPFSIKEGAAEVVSSLLRTFGYDDKQMMIVNGILSDGLFPRILICGELLEVSGLQPSGKYATAEDNSLCGLLMLLGYWHSNDELRLKNFFEYVIPRIYGDDLIAAVNPEVGHLFNNVKYGEFCETIYGLDFTDASKGKIEKEFITVDDMSFLRRKFVKNPRFDHVVAPLALDSIQKSLEWIIPSQSLNELEQHQSMFRSALYELVFHCDEKQFNIFLNFFKKALREHEPNMKISLPSYAYLMRVMNGEDICDAEQTAIGVINTESKTICSKAMMLKEGRISSKLDTNSPLDKGELWNFGRRLDDLVPWWSAFSRALTRKQRLANKFYEPLRALEKRANELELLLKETPNPFPGLRKRQIRSTKLLCESCTLKNACSHHFDLLSEYNSTKLTIKRYWSAISRSNMAIDIVTESKEVAMTEGAISGDTINVHENIEDVSGTMVVEKYIGNVTTLKNGLSSTLSLDDFFARPIAMANLTLNVDDRLTYSMDIWNTYLEHPSVRSKLRNYAFFSATMYVQIAISGSPFHYGKLQVAYVPLKGYVPSIERAMSNIVGVIGQRKLALCQLSQLRGGAVMDIKDNRPILLELPFIYPRPMARLFNDSPLVISSATDFSEMAGFGELFLNTINDVKCASATPSPISIGVYAYLKDVKLGTTTGTLMEIDTESKTVDERVTGPIERFSSSASSILHAMTSVPVIGQAAKASSIVLRGVSQLSALFGFSVPTMNTAPSRVKNEPFQNGAQVVGYDTGKKISLDPKQEVSVDPRALGTDVDEMSIAYICGVESYFDTFAWNEADLALSAPLWSAPVTPTYCREYTAIGVGTEIQPTALSFAAKPFSHWRGDITFRIEIVCSMYHRGKLAIFFEPNVPQLLAINTSLDLNKQYMKIIDIQETQDVSFCVEWAFPNSWAQLLDRTTDFGEYGFDYAGLMNYVNGCVVITPYTRLQSPDNSPVEVNMYVSSDNMVFNLLQGDNLPDYAIQTESKDVTLVDDTCLTLNPSSATMDDISTFQFGEMPYTFRSLVKRFCSYAIPGDDGITAGVGTGNIYYLAPIYPIPYPSFETPTGSVRVHNLISYLLPAYLGARGGIKHRVSVNGVGDAVNLARTLITLRRSTARFFPFAELRSHDTTSYPQLYGTVSFVNATNGGIEFETPVYTSNLFGFACREFPFPGIFNDNPTFHFEMNIPYNGSMPEAGYVIHDVAAAEDFSLMHFLCAPPYLIPE